MAWKLLPAKLYSSRSSSDIGRRFPVVPSPRTRAVSRGRTASTEESVIYVATLLIDILEDIVGVVGKVKPKSAMADTPDMSDCQESRLLLSANKRMRVCGSTECGHVRVVSGKCKSSGLVNSWALRRALLLVPCAREEGGADNMRSDLSGRTSSSGSALNAE